MTSCERAQVQCGELASDVAGAIEALDRTRPVWRSTRTGKAYQPGIGPHPETEVVRMVAELLAEEDPARYGHHALGAPYPAAARQKCDWVLGDPVGLAVEVKLLRLMGDNGKPNDNMLMHLLSPYPAHRSALTDCSKLVASGFPGRKVVLIYGFDYPDWSMDPAIKAFETLARREVALSSRAEAPVTGLVHPVHQAGRVFCWEIEGPRGGST